MSADRGVALLDVLVALSILAVAGFSALTAARESVWAVRAALEEEAALRAASAFLDAVALWPREDLERRLGERRQGGWVMRVTRPAPTLYAVALVDTATGRTLLQTSIFRREVRDAAP